MKNKFDLDKIRLDFVVEKVEIGTDEEGNKILGMRLTLDPKSWDYDKEKKAYFNKKLGLSISEEELRKALPSLAGTPLYHDSSLLKDDEKYLKELRKRHGDE